MIALALLFMLIIGLLSVIVWLLQKYFEMYSSLHITENTQLKKLQNQLKLQENTSKIFETEKEINTIINKRLTEMEEKFPTEQPQEELSEILTVNFKRCFILH